MNPEEAILGSTRPSLSELVPFPPGQAHAPSPEPLECLLEAPVPAFLSKTFDLVEDPSLDAIISWAPTGESFVVWDPVEFARFILPHNFKHSNFSSFVRQLNTYGNQRNPVGEFGMSCRGASSIFLQGFRKMHAERWEFANEGFLRGKRHLLRIIQRRKPPGSSGLPLEAEIGKMRKERMGMMQEVMELQKEQLGTVQDLEVVNKKLQAAEEGQKQMVSFMARLLGQMKKMKEPNAIIAPPRTTMGRMKRFAKHSPKETGMGSSLLGSDKRVIFGNALGSHEREMEHSLPPLKPKEVNGFPSSSPVKEEDVWGMGFGDLGSYGTVVGAIGAMSDVWVDTDPLQAATSSDMEMYTSYGEPADYI